MSKIVSVAGCVPAHHRAAIAIGCGTGRTLGRGGCLPVSDLPTRLRAW